jgi:hypothetical protein
VSAPRKHEDKLQGALTELVSAMSALNMEPEAVENPSGMFLSEVDVWAAHAMEHLEAVFELLREAHSERERDRERIHKLALVIESQQKKQE